MELKLKTVASGKYLFYFQYIISPTLFERPSYATYTINMPQYTLYHIYIARSFKLPRTSGSVHPEVTVDGVTFLYVQVSVSVC